jgi:hypothetical protein
MRKLMDRLGLKKDQAAESPPPEKLLRPINAKFQDRLEHILEELCSVRVNVEQHLRRADVVVQELLDYVNFEIEKIDLEIERSSWESKVKSIDDLQMAKAWKSRLESLKADLSSSVVMASNAFLRKLIDDLNDTFVE